MQTDSSQSGACALMRPSILHSKAADWLKTGYHLLLSALKHARFCMQADLTRITLNASKLDTAEVHVQVLWVCIPVLQGVFGA